MSNPSEVFVVAQRGVYRHDIGPFAFDLDQAIELAKARQALEKDNHHEFEVIRLISGSLGDGELVAVVRGLIQDAKPSGKNRWRPYELSGEQSVERLALARGERK